MGGSSDAAVTGSGFRPNQPSEPAGVTVNSGNPLGMGADTTWSAARELPDMGADTSGTINAMEMHANPASETPQPLNTTANPAAAGLFFPNAPKATPASAPNNPFGGFFGGAQTAPFAPPSFSMPGLSSNSQAFPSDISSAGTFGGMHLFGQNNPNSIQQMIMQILQNQSGG